MASLEEHYKEFLTCQICFDIYDIPKSLPCLHVFCQGCLDYWISQSTDDTQFPCPICRANFSKTGGGAADYLTNFHMNSMVDALKNILTKDGADKVTIESLCDICTASGENVTAEHRCIECDEKLCQSCGKTHRHSKLTKSHQVIDLTGDELKDAQAIIEVISTKNVYCSKHKDEPVKFFCTRDNEALCQVCFVTGHASHNCEDINESAKSKLKKVAKLIELATKREKRFENSINRTSNVIKAVDKAVEKAQQDAKEDKALAQTVLDTHYGDLEGNIYELKTAKVKALQAHAENLQLLKGIAETTKLQMMSLQQHGHPVEVVNMGNYITSKVEEWSQSFDPNKGTPVDEPIGIELYPCRIQDLQLSLANLPYEDDGNEDDDLESLGESVGDSVEDAAETLDQLDDKDEKEYLGPVHRGIKCDICTNKVQGIRFKCMVCSEFNLCSTCGSKWGIHRDHDMVRIHNPIGRRGRRGGRFHRGGRGSQGGHQNPQRGPELGMQQQPSPLMFQGPPRGGNQGGQRGGPGPRGGFHPGGPHPRGLHPANPYPGGYQPGEPHPGGQQPPPDIGNQRGGRGHFGRGGPANRGGRGGHPQQPSTPQPNNQQMPSGPKPQGGDGGKKKKQNKKGGKN